MGDQALSGISLPHVRDSLPEDQVSVNESARLVCNLFPAISFFLYYFHKLKLFLEYAYL